MCEHIKMAMAELERLHQSEVFRDHDEEFLTNLRQLHDWLKDAELLKQHSNWPQPSREWLVHMTAAATNGLARSSTPFWHPSPRYSGEKGARVDFALRLTLASRVTKRTLGTCSNHYPCRLSVSCNMSSLTSDSHSAANGGRVSSGS